MKKIVMKESVMHDSSLTVMDDLIREVAILAAGAPPPPAIVVVDLKAGLTMKFSPTSSVLCSAQQAKCTKRTAPSPR